MVEKSTQTLNNIREHPCKSVAEKSTQTLNNIREYPWLKNIRVNPWLIKRTNTNIISVNIRVYPWLKNIREHPCLSVAEKSALTLTQYPWTSV